MKLTKTKLELINRVLAIFVVGFLAFSPVMSGSVVFAQEGSSEGTGTEGLVEIQTETATETVATEEQSESSSSSQDFFDDNSTTSFLEELAGQVDALLSDPFGFADRIRAENEAEDAAVAAEQEQASESEDNTEVTEPAETTSENNNQDEPQSSEGSSSGQESNISPDEGDTQAPAGIDDIASDSGSSDNTASDSTDGNSAAAPNYNLVETPEAIETPTVESLIGDSSDPDSILEYLRIQREARFEERAVRTDDAAGSSETETTDLMEPDPSTAAENNLDNVDDANVTSVTETDTAAVVETDQTLAQENVTNGTASTGGVNVESGKDVLEATIQTGNSELSSDNEVKGNTSDVTPGNGGYGGDGASSWIQQIWGTDASNSETDGDDNTSTAAAKEIKDLTIINKNTAFISNIKNLLSLTGENSIQADGRCKDCLIDTGDALVKSSLFNIINTSTTDSKFLPISIDIFGKYDGNINILDLLFEMFGRALDGPGAVTSTASNDATDTDDSVGIAVAESIDILNVFNEDEGFIFNDLKLNAVSGRNRINAFRKVKDVAIKTGDAEVVNNIVNFLNNTLFKSKVGVVILNVYGEFNGSVIIPDALKIASAIPSPGGVTAGTNTSVAGSDDSLSTALAIANSELNIFNDTVGGVETKINVNANTGNNTAIFDKDGSQIVERTGEIKALSNILTLANRDIIGTAFSQTFVNTFGKWTGSVVGAENARIEGNASNFIIASESSAFGSADQASARANNTQTDTDDTTQAAVAKITKKITLNNKDTGFIANHLDINLDTGNNDIVSYKGTKVLTETGDAKVANNIASFMNNNISYSNGLIFILNTFDEWRGNVAFADLKDLAADVDLLSEPASLEPGDEVVYEVAALNFGTQPTEADVLSFDYDPNRLLLLDAAGGEVSGSIISWAIPVMSGGEKQSFRPVFEIIEELPDGRHYIDGTARVRQQDDNGSNNDERGRFTLDIGRVGEFDDFNTYNERGERQDTTIERNQTVANDPNTSDENTAGGDSNQATGDTSNPTSDSSDNNSNNSSVTPGSSNNNGGSYIGPSHTPGYLRVEKSVTSVGPFKPGDEVFYSIEVSNPGDSIVEEVIVYDVFGNGDFMAEESWPLQDVLEGETVNIGYHITIPVNAEPGTYTNNAYASGFDRANAVIRSGSISTSITVVNENYVAVSAGSGGVGGSFGVIDEFNAEATTTDDELTSEAQGASIDGSGGSDIGLLTENTGLTEAAATEIEAAIEDEIQTSSTISRYIPVAIAAEGIYFDESGQVLGTSDTSSSDQPKGSSVKLASAVYPNYLHFDGMKTNSASSDTRDTYFLGDSLLWILLVIAIILGYLSYKEKKRRRIQW